MVDGIATDLRQRSQAGRRGGSARRGEPAASLAGGHAGLAVFYSYLLEARARDIDRKTAIRFLNFTTRGLSRTRLLPSFYAGFTGMAWAATHLEGLGLADRQDLTAVDEALVDFVGRSPWQRDYDLVSGLVGFGLYAIERLPHHVAAESLKRVVDRLGEIAERTGEGISWFTPPELLTAYELERSPRGCYNLGVAHGVPGVIALLAMACAAGVACRKARTLLDGAVAWVEAQRLPRGSRSNFPTRVGPEIEPTASRSAWCYGDPGIAAALFVAARSVAEPAWERRALEIALNAAERPHDEAGVVDAALCHGSGGLGHIFNRFFQATGEERFLHAARSWFRRTLEFQCPAKGIGGYLTWSPGKGRNPTWIADPGILNGAAGIGLALLAAATPIEPAWDRMLLISTLRQRCDF